MDASKTEHLPINVTSEEGSINSISEDIIERVEDFKYLGLYVADSREDSNTRKRMEWSACIKLQKVWTSGISDELKVKLFRTCVKPVLLNTVHKLGQSTNWMQMDATPGFS